MGAALSRPARGAQSAAAAAKGKGRGAAKGAGKGMGKGAGKRAPQGAAASDRPSAMLRAYGLRPNKRLGQHFLVDTTYLTQIVDAAELAQDDTVLEVGPGLGVLTEALCERAGRVVAVEIDAAMRTILGNRLGTRANLGIVAADILKVDPVSLLDERRDGPAVLLDGGAVDGSAHDAPAAADEAALPAGQPHFGPLRPHYKVVANLPYYITSAVLRRLLEARERPVRAVVMVQKEVADRITASPGDLSVLAVAIQLHAAVRRVAVVPPGAFHPPPKVESAVLCLDLYDRPPVPVDDIGSFFRVVRAGFGQKRKQLKNSLAAGLDVADAEAVRALAEAGIDPTRRAQTLTLLEWSALTAAFTAAGHVRPPRAAEADAAPSALDRDADWT
ncbi:MAG: 16S rRNA (adenine(1518)-N(6)/adenine(1519)-N(6))-dimethyltransferase [Ardenticatenales bacterium]|nr:16S rRNA (adenine(1518)-N(6)/adenine(1519)-N(6))-dimethyltransferase [Ardenticatenales bacterium]